MSLLPLVGPTVGRAQRVGSLALVGSIALALVAPGGLAADAGDTPNAPIGVGAQIPSGLYGATQVPVTVTWHKPNNGIRPDTYWVKAVLAATGDWRSCYTYADINAGPYFSCTFADPFQTGQPYYIDVYAGAWWPVVYGAPAKVVYTPVTAPGKVQNPAAHVLSYGGGTAGVSVSWSAPAHDGGAAIDQYTVKAPYAPASCGTTGGLSCTLSGLAPGPTTISIYAHNAAGWGQWLLWQYTVPAEPTPTPKPVQIATPKPVQLAPTPTPIQPGRTAAASSSTLPAEASQGTAATAVPSQTSSLIASAASRASLDPNSDRSTNPNAGGSAGDGGPPYWLLALLGVAAIGSMIVAARLGRRHARPPSGKSQGGSDGQ